MGLELNHLRKGGHCSAEVGRLCAGQRLRGGMLVLSGLPGSGLVGGMLGRDTKVTNSIVI